jgi:hypothetical protein
MDKTSRNLKKNPNDKVYTPLLVALNMIEICDIKEDMSVLDPSKGKGVFYNNLPKCKKDYCEIDEDKDFFNYNNKVDLIIGNPPYSLWNKWIEHTMKLTDKFCYILGCFNFTPPRIKKIHDNGYGITYIKLLKIDWWFSPSYIVIFEKNKPSIIDVEPKTFLCDNCNSRCKRGRTYKGKKYGMNECSKKIIKE